MAFFNTPLRKAELSIGVEAIRYHAFGQTPLKELVVRNPDCLVYAGDDTAEDLKSLGDNPTSLKVFSKLVGNRGSYIPSHCDEEYNEDFYYYIENFAAKAGCKFYALGVFSDGIFAETDIVHVIGNHETFASTENTAKNARAIFGVRRRARRIMGRPLVFSLR